MKKIISLLLSLCILLISITGCQKKKTEETSVKHQVEKVFDYVLDAGTYTSLDYDYAAKYFEGEYDNWGGGGCSALAKVLDNGETIVGRNMDLNISERAAYIFKTDVEGSYKTINLMYTFRDVSPLYEDALNNGLNEEFYKVLPFMADDVLNEKGLYVEINMRNGEFWPTGESKFSCQSTNKESSERIYMFELGRYIGEHCASVDEAINYVKTLDIYSKDGYWNYCFLLADSTGHYGVLEFGQNEIYWNDYAPAQTNFYVNEELNAIEELKTGVGRYNTLMAGKDQVKTLEDMFNLIDSVSYFQFYDVDNCKFDYLSENVGTFPYATYNFVTAEENRSFIYERMKELSNYVLSLNRKELQQANEYWESTFTEVVNCNQKTIKVRFFEDDNKVLTLSFN